MGQKGFFDVERRLEAISTKDNPLETIKTLFWVRSPTHRAGLIFPSSRNARVDGLCTQIEILGQVGTGPRCG